MEINQEKINQFIQGKFTPVCAFCGNRRWNITSKVFQLMEFDLNGLNLGGATYPVIPVTCNNCGNTLFINAIAAGLLEPNLSSPNELPKEV